MIGSHVRRMATFGAAVGLSAGLVVTGLAVTTAGASGTPGLTNTSITIGATVPLSGIASTGYSEVGKAARAVFKYLNSKPGKDNGRSINFTLLDDCYGTSGFGCTSAHPNTTYQTNALLSIPVFATVGSLGTPTQDSVRSLLKANDTPQLFVNSGAKDWNDPTHYPGLFGYQPSYNAESKILAKYMLKTYPGQKTCFFGQSDDFGTDGRQGLVNGGLTPAYSQTYNVTSFVLLGGTAYIKPLVHNFQTNTCKVLFMDTIPQVTAAVYSGAKSLGFKPKFVISSVGSDPITVNKIMKKTPKTDPEVGAISFAPLPASSQKSPWKAYITKVLLKDPADFPGFKATTPIDGNMAYGVAWGVAFAEALHAAPTGNFTQDAFVTLLESTTFKQTPSLGWLRYTSSNHQGLSSGEIIKISSSTASAVVDPTLWTTDNAAGPVTKTTQKSSGIPSWLA